MNVASLVVSILAAGIALASVMYAKRQAAAGDAALAIDRERRLDERRPKLLGKLESVDQGESFRVCLVVEEGPTLDAMDVSIPMGQGVAFSRGVPGVYLGPRPADVPLRAFTYDARGNPAGIRPGYPAIWKIDFAPQRDPQVPVRLVVNCHGENGENWEIVLNARLESPQMSPTFDDLP